MSAHTTGLWTVGHEENNEWGIDAGVWGIAICADAPGDGTSDGNARRIVACVNACAGIPTYQLTAEDGAPLLLGDTIDALRKQRDDLLAASAELLSHKLPDGVERGGRLILEADCLNLDAIVARVKGGAA